MSDSLRLHGPQHARSSCPSPTPGIYSNSCPLSQWCHPTISSSVIHFSSSLQPCPASGSFQMSQFFASGGQVLEFHLQNQSFQWIFRTDFLKDGMDVSPCSPSDSQDSSSTPQFKRINIQCSAFFTVQLSHPYMTTGKHIALTRHIFVGKLMSLLFNVLSWS